MQLSVVLSVLALLNMFMQKKIADISKLLFMLKNTLDDLNSIRESDASWCNAADTDISNLETEHGITIKVGMGPMEITSFVSSIVLTTRGYSQP